MQLFPHPSHQNGDSDVRQKSWQVHLRQRWRWRAGKSGRPHHEWPRRASSCGPWSPAHTSCCPASTGAPSSRGLRGAERDSITVRSSVLESFIQLKRVHLMSSFFCSALHCICRLKVSDCFILSEYKCTVLESREQNNFNFTFIEITLYFH